MTAPGRRAAPLALPALFAGLALLALLVPLPAGAQVADKRFRLQRVARLDFPIGLQFTPTGDRLFVNERAGRIRIIERGRLLARPFATVEDRVVRFRANGNRGEGPELVFGGMPTAANHHGGILAFGPDGKLYVSHGDAGVPDRAQDPRVLGGKIYRLNPDGSIPSDNPFAGEPTFAYGIRNPFGLAFDPETGALWESENGPAGHDEINLSRRSKNYGWPEVQGRAGDRRFVDPVVDYKRTIVPTMMAFGGDALLPEYRGNLFFGTYTGTVHRLVLTRNRRGVARDRIFIQSAEGVVGMTMGPDGLYYTTPERVLRVFAPSAAKKSPSATLSPSPSPTPSPGTPTASPRPTGSPRPGERGSAVPVYALAGAIAAALGATIALLVRRARGGR